MHNVPFSIFNHNLMIEKHARVHVLFLIMGMFERTGDIWILIVCFFCGFLVDFFLFCLKVLYNYRIQLFQSLTSIESVTVCFFACRSLRWRLKQNTKYTKYVHRAPDTYVIGRKFGILKTEWLLKKNSFWILGSIIVLKGCWLSQVKIVMFQSNQLAQDEREKGTTSPSGSLILLFQNSQKILYFDGYRWCLYPEEEDGSLSLYLCVCKGVRAQIHTYIYTWVWRLCWWFLSPDISVQPLCYLLKCTPCPAMPLFRTSLQRNPKTDHIWWVCCCRDSSKTGQRGAVEGEGRDWSLTRTSPHGKGRAPGEKSGPPG